MLDINDMRNTVFAQPASEYTNVYKMVRKELPFWARLFVPRKPLNSLSTNSPYHLKLHELVHSESKNHALISYNIKPIDKKYLETIQNVSLYTKMMLNREESRTELRCKEILESLTPLQKEALEYLS